MARLTVEIEMSMVGGDLFHGHRLHPSQDVRQPIPRRQAIEEGIELSQKVAGLDVHRQKAEVERRFGHEGQPPAKLLRRSSAFSTRTAKE